MAQPDTSRLAHSEGTFRGAEDREIYWQAWRADVPTRAAIVLAHGAAEHSGRYGYVVERLVPAGYPIWALDHHGHGRSEGRRAVIDRTEHAVADLDSLVEMAAAAEPEAPLFLLGHSMGGAIALSYTFEHQRKLKALILSAPAAAVEATSPAVRLIGRVLSAVTPGLGVYDVDPSMISRDPAEVSAYANDPFVEQGKLPARTVAELTAAIETFPERVKKITIPLLVMHGSADEITPDTASRMVHENAGSADKRLKIYEGFYHEIFNEPKADRERVLEDLLDWLDAHTEGAA
jgi:acylglycerol lipase